MVNVLLGFGLVLYLWRKQATIFAFFGTAFFILMIGAPASAVRAGIMAAAAFGAFLIGRMQYSLLAVVLSASIMVLWNPLYLWYDAGFQLSFLATIAVIVSMRAVEAHLSSRALIKALQEIVWLSVWVYILLLPLLLLQFGTLTVFSVPANIVFLPFVPLAMLGSFVAALVALIFPPASVIVGWIAYLPLTFILRGTYAVNRLPDMSVPVHIPLIMVIIWYITLLFGIVYMEESRRQKQYEKNFHCPHHH
jgi:competence protein ComEC